METIISNKYVNAINKLSKKDIDIIYDDLNSLNLAYTNDKNFREILISGSLTKADKLNFVTSCLPKTNKKTLNLIKLLAQKNKLYLISNICKQLKLKLDKAQNIYHGEIISHINLSKKDIEAYENLFSKKLNIKLNLTHTSRDFDGVKIEVAEFGSSLVLSKSATKQKIINHILKGIGV